MKVQMHRTVPLEEARTFQSHRGRKRLISSGLGGSEKLSTGRWLFGGDLVLVGGGGGPGRVGGDTGLDDIDFAF